MRPDENTRLFFSTKVSLNNVYSCVTLNAFTYLEVFIPSVDPGRVVFQFLSPQ